MAHTAPEQKMKYGISLSVSPNMPKDIGRSQEEGDKAQGKGDGREHPVRWDGCVGECEGGALG
jgi:hypothetical protein